MQPYLEVPTSYAGVRFKETGCGSSHFAAETGRDGHADVVHIGRNP